MDAVVPVVMTAQTAAWITCAVTTSVKRVFFICGIRIVRVSESGLHGC